MLAGSLSHEASVSPSAAANRPRLDAEIRALTHLIHKLRPQVSDPTLEPENKPEALVLATHVAMLATRGGGAVSDNGVCGSGACVVSAAIRYPHVLLVTQNTDAETLVSVSSTSVSPQELKSSKKSLRELTDARFDHPLFKHLPVLI